MTNSTPTTELFIIGHQFGRPAADPRDKLRGEIGTLQHVLMNEDDDEVLFIVIEYQGRRYMGAMGFDSRAFCRQIYTLLQSHIGLSIKEIGDIDLP